MGGRGCGWHLLRVRHFFVEEVSRGVLVALVLDIGIALHIIIHVEDVRELDTVVYLHPLEREVVEVEPAQNDVEELGHLQEADTPLRLHQLLAGLTLVEVVLVQGFWLHVPLESELDAVVIHFLEGVLDGEDKILEVFLLLRLVLTLLAVSVVDHLALVEVPDEMAAGLVLLGLEGLLEGLEEDAVELLDVLLHLGLLVLPLEALDEVAGGDFGGEVAVEFAEQLLQLVEDAVLGLGVQLVVVGPLVDGLAELGGHVEGLQQAVHVAGGPDVGQSLVAPVHSLKFDCLYYNADLFFHRPVINSKHQGSGSRMAKLAHQQWHIFINLLMSESLSKPLNQSIKDSVEPVAQPRSLPADRASLNEVYTQSIAAEPAPAPQSARRYKIISGVGICLMVLGLAMFLLFPPLIQSQIVQQAIDQAVLGPDNEKFWAHFPGDSGTIITRNYSFFNLTNEEEFFLHGEKPVFREIEGYIITELEDFLDITYSEDMSKVKMKDWLHFDIHPDSRSFDHRFKILNVPALGFWFTLKGSRDQLIFIEGFSLLFTSIEESIVDTVLGQGVSSQYLPDYDTAYLELFQPAGISVENSLFLWNDTAFGFKNKNNIKYWVEAASSSFTLKHPSFSESALDLKDYFTLSDFELYFILSQMKEYTESLQGLIFDNHYCKDLTHCTGKELAVRQLAESYVTLKTPPVSSITPTDTICTDNVTCHGYFPQISAYYRNVYLVEHPEADPFLTFDVEMVRKWVDYNPTGKAGEYSKAESLLLHIGNLDALFNNGTLHDQTKKNFHDSTEYLINIRARFGLPSEEHTRVFWEWIKYLVAHLLRQGTMGNQVLGIANAFSGAIYEGFAYLQDHLQNTLLVTLLTNQLAAKTCDSFMATSLQTASPSTVASICNNYAHNLQSREFVQDSINTCRNKYGKEWYSLQKLGANNLQVEAYCDKTVSGGFGQLYHNMRVLLNDFYACDHTPNEYCSDYELALKQWANSSVTLSQPNEAGNVLPKSTSFTAWNSKASPIEYYHYQQKLPDKVFPVKTMKQAYELFNFDHIFSATSNVQTFKDKLDSELWNDYMRYITVFVGFKGLTNQRTAREYIFGYNDDYLLWRKNNYPPFGGDPSTPAYTAFNDLNVTKEEAVMEVQWHTGKANSSMTGQYELINGYTYLTTNYSHFNGNETYWVLETPWAENDFFYGTNGKSFAPDQPNSKNVSIYVPNLQRYGSGSLNESYPYERYGYDLSIAYLGRYIYESGEEYPDNKKYYQNYFGVFNETSVLGFPFFMTKHHFMNCSANWSSYVRVFNEEGTSEFLETSHWDDSYVIVEPYSGVSFQSTIFLQANYFHEPDELFKYNQSCMLPVFSIYRSGNLTEEKAHELFDPLTTALNVKTGIFYVGIVLTLIGLGVLVFGILNMRRIKNRNEQGELETKKSIKISMQEQKKKKDSLMKEEPEPELERKLIREEPSQLIREEPNELSRSDINEEYEIPKSEQGSALQ